MTVYCQGPNNALPSQFTCSNNPPVLPISNPGKPFSPFDIMVTTAICLTAVATLALLIYLYNVRNLSGFKTRRAVRAGIKLDAKTALWKHEEEMGRIALEKQKADYNAVYGLAEPPERKK